MPTETQSNDRSMFLAALSLANVPHETLYLGKSVGAFLVAFFDKANVLQLVSFDSNGAFLTNCWISDAFQNVIRNVPHVDIRSNLECLITFLKDASIPYQVVTSGEDEDLLTNVILGTVVFNAAGNLICEDD